MQPFRVRRGSNLSRNAWKTNVVFETYNFAFCDERFVTTLAPHLDHLETSWAIFGPCWTLMRSSWGLLEPSWDPLEPSLGLPRPSLHVSGASWGRLGHALELPEAIWRLLGPSGCNLRATWALFYLTLAPFWSIIAPSGIIFDLLQSPQKRFLLHLMVVSVNMSVPLKSFGFIILSSCPSSPSACRHLSSS